MEKTTLEPFIIPPTWSKLIMDTPVAHVWKAAVDELMDAFQIIVIGYSMPQTDTFFQYLLTLGLESNPNLHRVIVVNVDQSDSLKERYERVFSRGLKDRGGLKFISGHNFYNFVHHFMQQHVGDSAWPLG
jgi:hypothetical protein